MQSDLFPSIHQEVDDLFRLLWRPGLGQISDAAELHVSPDRQHVVFAGSVVDSAGALQTRIAQIALSSGVVRVLTAGPNRDRSPQHSPDGHWIAFLSDRQEAGDFQLYLLDTATGATRPAATVHGWIEYLHWSPDGARILLGVAGHGSDVSGPQGAITSRRKPGEAPGWAPIVESGLESDDSWRRLCVYECDTGRIRDITPQSCNIWQAVWCGAESVVAVVSSGAAEGSWYKARLVMIDARTGDGTDVHLPRYQLGCTAAVRSGQRLAFVEAICSDRGVVAGELHIIETATDTLTHIDTAGVDITCAEWCSETRLLLAGHRGLETVVGVYDVMSGTFTQSWVSSDISTNGLNATVCPLNDAGDCVLVGEGFFRGPEIAVIRHGEYRTVKSFDLGLADHVHVGMGSERLCWKAPDDLELQGWLLRSRAEKPNPLIMFIHGGPVWHWRPMWLGRLATPLLPLLERGYDLFLPNPRGSSGRGQEFARHVLGDIAGTDAHDLLAGIDFLVDRQVADPARLGIMGRSYGGLMTSWLICQDTRFSAAVSVAPITNHVTQHLLSNIPQFTALFLGECHAAVDGKYLARSPVMYAHRVRTPTLNVCGALDRCTPPEQARQFHQALVASGARSVLVTYPEEGHGVQKYPALIDYVARVVCWFEEHMPALRGTSATSGRS